MSSLETTMALEADFPEASAAAGDAGSALVVDESDPAVLWLTLRPPKDPGQTFFVRIAWDDGYPHSPPSVKFADAVGGRVDVSSAWPVIPGYRPGELDICQPFTSEGFKVHPEWVEGPEAWPATGNPLLWVVNQLIGDMFNCYQGRSG